MREPVHVTVWSPADPERRDAVPALFVHGIFTWGDDDAYGFAAQRSLADDRPLLLMDSRGYGLSPDTARSDVEVDADDLVELLDEQPAGAHTSSGTPTADSPPCLPRPGTGRRPLARADPAVGTAGRRGPSRGAHPADPSHRGHRTAAPGDRPRRVPPPLDGRHGNDDARADAGAAPGGPDVDARTTGVGVGPAALAPLAAAPWPSLVITGTWDDAPEMYRRYAGEPLLACAEAVAARIGARRLRVPGYYPHTQYPGAVNVALRALWASAG